MLTLMQQLLQRPNCQLTSVDRYVMLPPHFDGSNPKTARKHWAVFEKYIEFQRRQGGINMFDDF